MIATFACKVFVCCFIIGMEVNVSSAFLASVELSAQIVTVTSLTARSKKRRAKGGRKRHEEDRSEPKPSTVTVSDASRRDIRPASTKRLNLSIASASGPDLPIAVYQVDDPDWWEAEGNDNPYGGRCWPSALAVADCLANDVSLENRTVLELGCGPGIPSLVAASRGARVIASDISPVALALIRDGWESTSKKAQLPVGLLSVQSFDIFSNDPLPLHLANDSQLQPIVIGSAMTYDVDVAKGLAKRLIEACRDFNAWVILGDDDTGERDGGRALFLKELDCLEGVPKLWTHVHVKNDSLGWRDKPSRILQLNHPPSDQTE